MKVKIIEVNPTHVKANVFVGDACNGTLVFTVEEWAKFCEEIWPDQPKLDGRSMLHRDMPMNFVTP